MKILRLVGVTEELQSGPLSILSDVSISSDQPRFQTGTETENQSRFRLLDHS
jgi:hypothetical protein